MLYTKFDDNSSLSAKDELEKRAKVLTTFQERVVKERELNPLLLNMNETLDQRLPILWHEGIAVDDFMRNLDDCLKCCEQIKDNSQLMAFLTHYVFNTLPMPDKKALEDDGLVNSFWKELTPIQQLICFEKIEKLSYFYESTIYNNDIPWPEHKANLGKIYAIGDFLIKQYAKSFNLNDLIEKLTFKLPEEVDRYMGVTTRRISFRSRFQFKVKNSEILF